MASYRVCTLTREDNCLLVIGKAVEDESRKVGRGSERFISGFVDCCKDFGLYCE